MQLEEKIKAIKHGMVDRNLTIEQLADKIGVKRTHLYNVMSILKKSDVLDKAIKFLEIEI